MSVPAMNAFAALDRSTSTRMPSSASACSQASYRPSYMAHVMALR